VKIDPRSDRIALHYTGNDAGEPAISGVPARDLTENDIARLLTIEHGDGLRGAARTGAIDKLVDELTAGPYRRTAPSAKAPARQRSNKAAGPRGTSAPTPSPAPSTPPAEPSATTPKEA